MKKQIRSMLVIILAGSLLFGLVAPAQAQEEELRLSVRKRFGYSMGGQIQGIFKLSVEGPPDLSVVTFTLAGEAQPADLIVLGRVTEPPFALTFSTDNYPHGRYQIAAVGQTAGGRIVRSKPAQFEFVSAEVGWQTAGRIIIPIFALLAVVMLGATLGPFLLERLGKKPRVSLPPGAPRNYGLMGGAICPKCKRPFGLHWWAPNLMTSKFDRCPHCGKWSIVGRAGREALAAAESAELQAAAPPAPELSPEEKLRRQIEESRYL